MPESIGSVSVQVIADYSKMVAGFQTAQAEAQKAGSSIATSFTQAASGSAAFSNGVTNASAATSKLTSTVQGVTTAQTAATGATNAHSAALSHQVSELQATSAAIRTFEGNAGLRAVENFVSKTLGAGPLLKTLFPIVGVVATAEIVGHLIEKVKELEKAAREAALNINSAFHDLGLTFQTTNDELQVTSDKLANEIAILQGRPENRLLEELDKSRVMADKLASSIENAIEQIQKLLEAQSVGASGLLFGVAPTTGAADELTGFKRKLGTLDDQIRNAVGNENATKALIAERYDTYEKEIAKHSDHLAEYIKLQGERAKNIAAATRAGGGVAGAAAQLLNPSQSANIALEQGEIDKLRQQQQFIATSQTVSKQTTQRDALKAQSEDAKKYATEQMATWREELAFQETQGAVSVEQKKKYWDDILTSLEVGSANYRKVLMEVGSLNQQLLKQQEAETRKGEQEYLRSINDTIAQASEQAGEAGNHAAATRLKLLQQMEAVSSGSTAEALARQIPAAKTAARHEDLSNLHKSLADEEAAWKESENRTAADTIAFFELRKSLYSNDAEVVRRANEQIAAAHRKQAEEQFRVTDLQSKNTAAAGLSDVESNKIKLQSDFDLKSVATAQDRIRLAQALADQDARGLQIKLEQADADLQAARVKKDSVAIQQALNEQAAAQRDIDIQRESSEARILKMKQEESLRGQVARGLSGDVHQAGQSLASSFSSELVNSGKVGQVFREAVKGLESSALTTILSAAWHRAVVASGIDTLFNKLGGIATATPQIAATTANTAATAADTAAVTANAAASTALVATNTAMVASMAIQDISTTANTVALAALTAAVIELSTIEAISAFLPFAEGGRPPVGVPSIVGEKGPELFIPDSHGMIIPADKTKAMLAQLSMPSLNIGVPSTPSGMFGSNAGLSNIIGGASSVTNQNTGSIGSMHFAIYDTHNPRQTAREIAEIMKRQSPRFSPSNLGPQTA